MLVAFILLLFVGGIALAQAVSDPHAVTLRWLRLGGIIAITLLAVAVTVLLTTNETSQSPDYLYRGLGAMAVLAMMVVFQLVATQRAAFAIQRGAAAIVTATAIVTICDIQHALRTDAVTLSVLSVLIQQMIDYVSLLTSAALLGGCLMTMLLGHAYLTAGGEMTQKPFARLVNLLIVALTLRASLTMLAGFLPWYRAASEYGFAGSQLSWQAVMVCARLLVGIVVPGIFLYMTRDCVRRRANQSATGILYVLAVTLIIGEGVALTLVRSTGWAF